MKTKQTLLQEGEKGFREGSVEELLMQRWHLRHQAQEKHTGLKGTQVVCVFMTLNIQRG